MPNKAASLCDRRDGQYKVHCWCISLSLLRRRCARCQSRAGTIKLRPASRVAECLKRKTSTNLQHREAQGQKRLAQVGSGICAKVTGSRDNPFKLPRVNRGPVTRQAMQSRCSEHCKIGQIYLGVAVASFQEPSRLVAPVTLRDEPSRDKGRDVLDECFVTAFVGSCTEALSQLREEASCHRRHDYACSGFSARQLAQ